jgi:tRNA(Ile2) C34 agmatinyltransferase TiaS
MACCGLYLRKENETMSEEIKKEVQDVELNPEDIEKVSGGKISTTPKCPNCGEYLDWNGGFGTYICPKCGYHKPKIDGYGPFGQ